MMFTIFLNMKICLKFKKSMATNSNNDNCSNLKAFRIGMKSIVNLMTTLTVTVKTIL